ncbi:carbohydrate kinase [Nocardia sp. NPDC058176]|uniref:carbohydrate kinase family protein n=1 Tax=Nocardia sp. NPDC058176 TaxID=3346368 RepID=UPI0036DD8FC1
MTDDNGALVIGEALIDIVVRDGRTRAEHVGGSPLNVAVGLARLGRDVAFRTRLGADPHGERIARYLTDSGIRLLPGEAATRTSTAVATLGADGSAEYEFDLLWDLPATTESVGAQVIHTGSIAALLEPGCLAVTEILRAGRPTATITYDPNIRPSIIGDDPAAHQRVEHLVSLSDVVKVSDEDLHWIDPSRTPEQIARDWLATGPSLVAVTTGARGAFAVCATGITSIPAHPVEVVDTVGAGDAFTAGLIDALWSADLLGAQHRATLSTISTDTLTHILRTATLTSALTVARPGADPPDRTALDAAIAACSDNLP